MKLKDMYVGTEVLSIMARIDENLAARGQWQTGSVVYAHPEWMNSGEIMVDENRTEPIDISTLEHSEVTFTRDERRPRKENSKIVKLIFPPDNDSLLAVGSSHSSTALNNVVYANTTYIRHDMAFNHLVGAAMDLNMAAYGKDSCGRGGDIPLSRIGRTTSEFDRRTPDVIYRVDRDKFIVLEFTTTTNKGVDRATEKKHLKYVPPLEVIAKRYRLKIFFGVIVVTPEYLHTTFPIRWIDGHIREGIMMRAEVAFRLEEGLTAIGLGATAKSPETHKEVIEALNVASYDTLGLNYPYMRMPGFNRVLKEPNMPYLEALARKEYMNACRSTYDDNNLVPFLKELSESPNAENSYRIQREKNVERCDTEAQKLVDDLNREAGDNPKENKNQAINPFPCILMAEDKLWDSTLSPWPALYGPDDTTCRVWLEAVTFAVQNSGKADNEKFYCEMLPTDGEEEWFIRQVEHRTEVADKSDRNKYRRVVISYSENDKIELAIRGVGGKALKFHKALAEPRLNSKKVFRADFDVSSIDRDIEEMSTFLPAKNFQSTKDYDLIEEHVKDYGSWPTHMDVVDTWTRTNLSTHCRIVSDIAIELAISFKQGTGPNQMILKKLHCYPIYMLIKTTKSSGSIFFSLLWHKDKDFAGDMSNVNIFREKLSWNDYYYTEFISVDSHKIQNWIKCSSAFIGIQQFWAETLNYNMRSDTWHEDLVKGKEFGRHLCLSLLIYMENKDHTEQAATTLRYVALQGMVGFPSVPMPYKMFYKYNMPMRSRLQLWITQKVLKFSRMMCEMGGFTRKNSTKSDGTNCWVSVPNVYFPNQHFRSHHHMTNMFYIGYLKDKDSGTQTNQEAQLIEKIVKIDDTCPDDGTEEALNLGVNDPEEPLQHTYSPSWLRYCCDKASKALHKSFGKGWEKVVHTKILDDLYDKKTSDLATLKASSLFSEEFYSYNEAKNYKRSKAAIEIMTILSDLQSSGQDDGYAHKVMHLVKTCLADVESREHMRIDIFKKQQHGGLREIYVMGMSERVLQSVVEQIARSVCSFFLSETMMHPSSKKTIPRKHSQQATERLGRKHITIGASRDAEKWNQGHMVTKFMQLLCYFAPPELHNVIERILAMFLRKRMMIPQKLMKTLVNNADTVLSENSFFGVLRDVVHGRQRKRWYDHDITNCSYIETASGMMQGILHYTSSLLHTVHQECMRLTVEEILTGRAINAERELTAGRKTDYGEIKMNGDGSVDIINKAVVVSVMQSSDDSAMLISVRASDPGITNILRIAVDTCFRFVANMARYLAIYDSRKTVCNTPFFLEFNSEYYFYDSQIRPTLRWLMAAFTVSTKDSLLGRQEEMSTGVTSLLEGGGTHMLCFTTQVGQMLMFYRMIGYRITAGFEVLMKYNKVCKDPNTGYFLLDHPIMAGLLGFQFTVYHYAKTTNYGKILKSSFSKLQEVRQEYEAHKVVNHMFSSQAMAPSTRGDISNITATMFVLRKGFKNYQEVLEHMDLVPNWQEEIDKDPEFLYMGEEDTDDCRLMITKKMHSKGVAETLGQRNDIFSALVTSAYITNTNIVEFKRYYLDMQSTKEPSNLMRVAFNQAKQADLCLDELTDEDLSVCFPVQHGLYKAYFEFVNKYEGRFLSDCLSNLPMDKRRVNTRVTVTMEDYGLIMSPIRILKYFWFDRNSEESSPRVMTNLFNKLKTVIQWVEKGHDASLASSPFDHAHEMHSFLTSLESKGRTVEVSAVPLTTFKGSANVYTEISRNQVPHYMLEQANDRTAVGGIGQVNLLRRLISLSFRMPYVEEDLRLLRDYAMLNFGPSWDERATRSPQNSLHVLCEIFKRKQIKEDPDSTGLDVIDENLWNKIATIQNGLLISWADRTSMVIESLSPMFDSESIHSFRRTVPIMREGQTPREYYNEIMRNKEGILDPEELLAIGTSDVKSIRSSKEGERCSSPSLSGLEIEEQAVQQVSDGEASDGGSFHSAVEPSDDEEPDIPPISTRTRLQLIIQKQADEALEKLEAQEKERLEREKERMDKFLSETVQASNWALESELNPDQPSTSKQAKAQEEEWQTPKSHLKKKRQTAKLRKQTLARATPVPIIEPMRGPIEKKVIKMPHEETVMQSKELIAKYKRKAHLHAKAIASREMAEAAPIKTRAMIGLFDGEPFVINIAHEKKHFGDTDIYVKSISSIYVRKEMPLEKFIKSIQRHMGDSFVSNHITNSRRVGLITYKEVTNFRVQDPGKIYEGAPVYLDPNLKVSCGSLADASIEIDDTTISVYTTISSDTSTQELAVLPHWEVENLIRKKSQALKERLTSPGSPIYPADADKTLWNQSETARYEIFRYRFGLTDLVADVPEGDAQAFLDSWRESDIFEGEAGLSTEEIKPFLMSCSLNVSNTGSADEQDSFNLDRLLHAIMGKESSISSREVYDPEKLRVLLRLIMTERRTILGLPQRKEAPKQQAPGEVSHNVLRIAEIDAMTDEEAKEKLATYFHRLIVEGPRIIEEQQQNLAGINSLIDPLGNATKELEEAVTGGHQANLNVMELMGEWMVHHAEDIDANMNMFSGGNEEEGSSWPSYCVVYDQVIIMLRESLGSNFRDILQKASWNSLLYKTTVESKFMVVAAKIICKLYGIEFSNLRDTCVTAKVDRFDRYDI